MNKTLVTPNTFELISTEEMMYIEGGLEPNQINVDRSLLDKSTCTAVAAGYTSITGLSQDRLAREIYSHAFLYYASVPTCLGLAATAALVGIPLGPAGIVAAEATVAAGFIYIRSHSNPIDLGNDSDMRVAIYNFIWDHC